MKRLNILSITVVICHSYLGAIGVSAPEQETAGKILTLPVVVNLALEQNPKIVKARSELQRTHGVIVETRAEAMPQVRVVGQYTENDVNFIDTFPGGSSPAKNQQRPWRTEVEVSQLVYSGGRVNAALQAARLMDRVALLDYNRVVANTLYEVQRAFYEILLNRQLVAVRQESFSLLERQLKDARHRYAAGAVPQFTVLRAEVELANAQPPLIRAHNDLRLSKEKLVRLLALDGPRGSDDFTAITFEGELHEVSRSWDLSKALDDALNHRPELSQARLQVHLEDQNIAAAKSGYQPELSVFASYGVRNTLFSDQLDDTINGWAAGAQLSWNIFDGLLTKGRVEQATAERQRAQIDLEERRREIELEVRQAFSEYQQAQELIDAQVKTVEQAVEGLRLAEARFRAGSGTQLDVLSAQTALTQARSNEIQAMYDYNVALIALDRATGTKRHNVE